MGVRMKRVVLYSRRSIADGGESVDTGLARLRRHADARGWNVVEEVTDADDRHDTRRDGWKRCLSLVDGDEVDVVAIESLYRLFPRLDDVVVVASRWAADGVGLVSLDDALDTSRPEDALPWKRVLATLQEYVTARHREATRVGIIAQRLANQGQPLRGRPVVAVDDVLLAMLWHSGTSTREIVRRVKASGGRMSMGTLYKALDRLRAAGKLDDEKRAEAKRRNPPSKGGRPRKKRRKP